ILDLLRERSATTSELCAHFNTTRFAVMKHLKVLERAGLIVVERRGRARINHLNPVPLQQIYRRWIQPFAALPADRLLRLKAIAENNRENHS
ncbi:MAG: helix-turn-helix domain-containing protein, partial [Pseudomonadota bacterium]